MDNKLTALIDLTKGATYGGGGLAGIIGLLSFEQWLGIGGLLFIAINYFTGLYFQRRHLRIAQQRLDLEINGKRSNDIDG